jgi:hypothetical protein
MRYITLFKAITIFNRIFLTFSLNVVNILHNIVNPTKHCYDMNNVM